MLTAIVYRSWGEVRPLTYVFQIGPMENTNPDQCRQMALLFCINFVEKLKGVDVAVCDIFIFHAYEAVLAYIRK